MTGRLRVAVLVSGEGTTAEALVRRYGDPHAPVEIVIALADRACPAVARLTDLGIPVDVVPTKGAEPVQWGAEVVRRLTASGVELVVLAGFLSVLPGSILEQFRDRVINVHPSLLPLYGGPGMFGSRVHAAVLADRAEQTGATVHLVSLHVDAGPVLWQGAVAVGTARTPGELRERVRPLELQGLTEVIEAFAREGHAPPPVSPR